jgi:hypothetical protein
MLYDSREQEVLLYEACLCAEAGNIKLMAYKYLLCQHLEAVLMFHVYIFD